MTEKELLINLAKAWNNLDVSFIENLLIDEFKYASQWVFDEMNGKINYLDYLSAKFESIKNGIKENGDEIFAELAIVTEGFPNKPCIVLTQIRGNNVMKVTLLIEAMNEMIGRIDMCAIPTPESAILTGLIPK